MQCTIDGRTKGLTKKGTLMGCRDNPWYFPIGRMNVCDEDGRYLGGVMLSIVTKWKSEASYGSDGKTTDCFPKLLN